MTATSAGNRQAHEQAPSGDNLVEAPMAPQEVLTGDHVVIQEEHELPTGLIQRGVARRSKAGVWLPPHRQGHRQLEL